MRRALMTVCCLLTISIAGLLVWEWPAPVQAASKPVLTLSQLRQRLDQPVKRDGQQVIDLRHFQIDLQDDAFRQTFYGLTQTALKTGTVPLGIDLSEACIEGNLDLSQLGLRTPLLGDGLIGLLPDAAKQQFALDRHRVDANRTTVNVVRGRLSLAGTTIQGDLRASNTYFLSPLEIQNAVVTGDLRAAYARFVQDVNATAGQFHQATDFSQAIFFRSAIFEQAQFWETATFSRSEFRDDGRFSQASFQAPSTFEQTYWQGTANFDRGQFQQTLSFNKAQFASALTLAEALLRQPISFRQAQFGQAINLRGAALLQQADFGDARFASDAIINVPDLDFDPATARLLGTPDQLGQQLSVPALTGNEAVLKSLIRNFRQLEQIADANQVEYTLQRLRLRRLAQQLRAIDLNHASFLQLGRLGLTAQQAQAVLDYRNNAVFVRPADVLKLPEIGAADYWQISDRIVTDTAPTWGQKLAIFFRWLGLGLLMVLSRYGTNFTLVLGVGWVIIAPFALTYWWLDRDRSAALSTAVFFPPLLTYLGLITTGLVLIYHSSPTPGATLMGLTLLVVPPLTLSAYRLKSPPPNAPSYFTQDGSARQLRLLIARLPVMPEYYFFRNRYTHLVRSRRWNWLNYFDFSVNNSLRFGFNDTRLRDLSVPGALSWLVWYQWTLGVLYIALLLWTLSRTIPGLNLLLYF
ncbi:MAG: helix-hairpin-helix domain-containing protein [Cyanobacteria bacterium J06632_22]